MFFVRTASAADIPAIAELLRQTWHATYDGIYGRERVEEITRDWHAAETLRPRVGRRDAEFLVADDGENLGGTAFAAYGADRSAAILHQLYVRPDCQRQGIGSDLLAEIVDAFPEASRLRVEVEEANTGASAFYVRQGFAAVQIEPEATGDAMTSAIVVMEKPLVWA